MCWVKFTYLVYYLIKIVDLDKMPNVFKLDQTHAKFPVCLGSIKKASCTLTFGWQGKIPEVTLLSLYQMVCTKIYHGIPFYIVNSTRILLYSEMWVILALFPDFFLLWFPSATFSRIFRAFSISKPTFCHYKSFMK